MSVKNRQPAIAPPAPPVVIGQLTDEHLSALRESIAAKHEAEAAHKAKLEALSFMYRIAPGSGASIDENTGAITVTSSPPS